MLASSCRSRRLYALQKFDSGTWRRFAVILERDADKWLKPAKAQLTKAPTYGPKPWHCLLIPHDQVTEDKRLTDYLEFAQL